MLCQAHESGILRDKFLLLDPELEFGPNKPINSLGKSVFLFYFYFPVTIDAELKARIASVFDNYGKSDLINIYSASATSVIQF